MIDIRVGAVSLTGDCVDCAHERNLHRRTWTGRGRRRALDAIHECAVHECGCPRYRSQADAVTDEHGPCYVYGHLLKAVVVGLGDTPSVRCTRPRCEETWRRSPKPAEDQP